MKNNKKVIIISIIVLIVIIIGAISCLYFFTDTFLSTDKRFYKYIGKSLDVQELFEDEQLEKYAKKQEQQGVNNNGEISINIDGSIVEDEKYKSIVDEIEKYKIAFSGSKDDLNKYSYQDIAIKNDSNDILAFSYINQDDYYGIKIENVIKKYITFENNNLKEFATKLGLTDTSKVPDKINFSALEDKELFSKQELKELKNKYLKAITDNLTKDMFSKNNEGEETIYTLSINEQQAKKIIFSVIDTFENDEILMNKIKEIYMEVAQTSEEEVNELISNLKSALEDEKENYSSEEESPQLENANEETLDISVHVSNGKTSKIEIGIPDSTAKITITINDNSLAFGMSENEEDASEYIELFKVEKEKTNDMLSYKFTTTEIGSGANIEFGVSYTGIEKMTEIQENYYLKLYADSNSEGLYNGDNGIITEAKKASENNKNLMEKEQVGLAINEMVTEYYQNSYIDGKDEKWEINETKIKEYLTKSEINATVTKNTDGTYKIQTESGNVYTVDSNGKITNTEFAQTQDNQEKIVSDDEETESISITLNVNNKKTFGDVTRQELNEQNMYLVNDKDMEQLSSTFSQLVQKIITNVATKDKNIGELLSLTSGESYSGGILSDAGKAKDTINSVDLSEQAKLAFNTKFTAYEGTNVSGSKVNSLIQAVIISNQAEISNDSNMYVTITFPNTTGKQVEIGVKNGKQEIGSSQSVATGKTYKVALGYKDGIVNTITVTEN